MTKIGIKVRNYTSEVNIIDNNDIERRVFKALLLSFGVLSLFYVLFLGNMIFNIVERRNIEHTARNLSNEVMELEAQYLAKSSKLDLSLSHSLGFKEVTPSYATRPSSLGLGSNSNGNEI